MKAHKETQALKCILFFTAHPLYNNFVASVQNIRMFVWKFKPWFNKTAGHVSLWLDSALFFQNLLYKCSYTCLRLCCKISINFIWKFLSIRRIWWKEQIFKIILDRWGKGRKLSPQRSMFMGENISHLISIQSFANVLGMIHSLSDPNKTIKYILWNNQVVCA